MSYKKVMFFLYYSKQKSLLFIQETRENTKNLELLETNGSLEKLVLRAEMYQKQYKCEVEHKLSIKPDGRKVNRIRNKNNPRYKHSEETKQRISDNLKGDKNPRFGVVDPSHIRLAKSEKLKLHYQFNVHARTGVKDSDETKLLKSVNNNNKGGWFWVFNPFTKEEKRCYGDIPEGFRRGRLHNYVKYLNANRNK
jgi:hypothetical protein